MQSHRHSSPNARRRLHDRENNAIEGEIPWASASSGYRTRPATTNPRSSLACAPASTTRRLGFLHPDSAAQAYIKGCSWYADDRPDATVYIPLLAWRG